MFNHKLGELSLDGSRIVLWCLSIGVPVGFFVFAQILRQQSMAVAIPFGWDQPYYVFEANLVVANGVFSYVQLHGVNLYYSFYILIAAFGTPLGNNKLGLIVFELLTGIVYTALISKVVFNLNNSFIAAFIGGIISVISINFVRLMVLPRELFVLTTAFFILLRFKNLSNSFKLTKLTSWIYILLFSLIFWWSAANGVVLLLVFVIYSYIRRCKKVLYYAFTSFILGMIPTVILFLSSKNPYVSSGPSAATVVLSSQFVADEFLKWLGGDSILLIITIMGFLVLAYKYIKSKDNTFPLLIFLWGISILLLFGAACIAHSIVADWSIYADRSLLIFPTSIALSQGFFFIYSAILEKVRKNVSTI